MASVRSSALPILAITARAVMVPFSFCTLSLLFRSMVMVSLASLVILSDAAMRA